MNPPLRLGALLVVAAGLAIAATPASAAGTEYVLVDANADGDTPVSGGLVSVARCDRTGTPLRQINGSSAERTYRTGATLLEFARLPACFVVSVSGGSAAGRPLGGTFVARHSNEPDRLMNVPVTPVSTLVAEVMDAHRGWSEQRAFRSVQRRLHIPAYFDEFDLEADDSVFDGDRYLTAARRAGGIARLNRALPADGRSFRRLGGEASAAQGGALAKWWKELDLTKAALSGFQDFGLSVLVDNVLKPGGKWVLGRFLDLFGNDAIKDFFLPKDDTERLIEMVEQLTKRVNALERSSDQILVELAELRAQVKADQVVALTERIDTNQQDLQDLAKLDPAKPGFAGLKDLLMQHIAADEPNRNLLGSFLVGRGGNPGLLDLESKRSAAKRFFTPRDSARIRSVYEYYVLYQLRFAHLLTEYWNSRSCSQPAGVKVAKDCLAPETIARWLSDFPTNVQAQEAQLKPAVPANHFVDVRRHMMWVSNPPWVSGLAYKPPEQPCPGPRDPYVSCSMVSEWWRSPGLDLAGLDDFRALIESVPAGGENPFAYLAGHAGLVSGAGPSISRDHIGDMWLGLAGTIPNRFGAKNGYKPVNRLDCYFGCYYRIERVHLQADQRDPKIFTNDLYHQDPESHWAHAMPRPQPVAPGTFWYE